jgi:DNA polymerase III alpha subunit (gram-positive type)
MFKVLIFDTETGGLSPERNDLLQLSYQVVDADEWKVLSVVNHYFEWTSPNRVEAGALAVNGLTEEFLSTVDCSNRHEALRQFLNDLDECDAVVAHNFAFDRRFLEWNCDNEGLGYPQWPSRQVDTMKETKNYCQLPPRPGRRDYKYPKLCELAYILDINQDDLKLHDSSADVELSYRCLHKLCDKSIIDLY